MTDHVKRRAKKNDLRLLLICKGFSGGTVIQNRNLGSKVLTVSDRCVPYPTCRTKCDEHSKTPKDSKDGVEYMAAKKKITLYFPEDLLEETKLEADRQDRSLSWIIQMAWLMSRDRLQDLPGVGELRRDLQDAS